MSDLGLFKDYGNIIITIIILSWGVLYTFLCNDYDPIDDHE
jgi:hypothetical protein